MAPQGARGTASPTTGRGVPRRLPRWVRLALSVAVLGVVLALVLRAPAATSDFVSAFRRFQPDRLPLLVPAVACEIASLTCAALAERRLLRAGGVDIATWTMLGLTTASTAVVDLIPAGIAPASGWLIEQYRERGAPVPLGLWAVLASGFAAAVTLLGLLLAGAGIAGVWTPLGLLVAGVVLVVGSVGFVMASHHVKRRGAAGRARHPLWARVATTLENAAAYRISARGWTVVLTWSLLNWLLDAACLALAFALLGLPVPFDGLVFAYAASQAAGGLSLLPAGIGAVEGGMVGGFVLTGTPAAPALAATLVYRVVAYWLVAAVGTAVLVVQTRRRRAAGPPGPGAGEGPWALGGSGERRERG